VRGSKSDELNAGQLGSAKCSQGAHYGDRSRVPLLGEAPVAGNTGKSGKGGGGSGHTRQRICPVTFSCPALPFKPGWCLACLSPQPVEVPSGNSLLSRARSYSASLPVRTKSCLLAQYRRAIREERTRSPPASRVRVRGEVPACCVARRLEGSPPLLLARLCSSTALVPPLAHPPASLRVISRKEKIR
jgi:hypothetical protein